MQEAIFELTSFWKAGEDWDIPQPYSTDIAAAWTIVDKLKDRYTDIDYEGDGGDWRVFFSDDTFGLSQHVEVAICRAALKAVGE